MIGVRNMNASCQIVIRPLHRLMISGLSKFLHTTDTKLLETSADLGLCCG